mgnify:CR=1 FL=1
MSDWLRSYRENHADFDQPAAIELLSNNPFEAFSVWFDAAVQQQEIEANACVLSTYNAEKQQVSARVLYLKELIDREFIFYTNYTSHKGNDLQQHPNATLLFFWPKLMRQIRIEGSVSQVSAEVSDAYFASRTRESQLGAWASLQSNKLASRQALIEQFEALDAKFPNEVPRPPHWGGYALSPNYFEFWQGQPSRLHERRAYSYEQNKWQTNLLNP